MTLHSTFVRAHESEDGLEVNGLDFDFHDAQDQRFLQQQLVKEEIRYCMQFSLD